MKIKYRSATNTLSLAKQPQPKTNPFVATVWNKGSAINTGDTISATDSLGIGLVVDTQPTAYNPPFVEYTLGEGALFSGTGVLMKLKTGNQIGWPLANWVIGDEAANFIQFNTAETAPQTNGAWKALADGVWRVTLQGHVQINLASGQYPLITTDQTGSTSLTGGVTPDPHSHTLPSNHWNIIGIAGCPLSIDIYNKKASGGANAVLTDPVSGQFCNFFTTAPLQLINAVYMPIHASWLVPLSLNDVVSLRASTSMLNGSAFELAWNQGQTPRLRFEYLNPVKLATSAI